MTPDELRIRLKLICDESEKEMQEREDSGGPYKPPWERRAHKQLVELFAEHRGEVFEISKKLGDWLDCTDEEREQWTNYFTKWSVFEKEISTELPDMYVLLRQKAVAFFTCSCGSREDSCDEDGDGNFSTFIFMPDGEVFRKVEKKS